MTATRTRKQIKRYSRYRKKMPAIGENCAFCEMDESNKLLIRTTKYFKLVKNKFPYSMWDEHEVLDHLMVVPIQHIDTLADLPDKASVAFVKLISDYEQQGYNIYARAPESGMKSVAHQHTHLIKSGRKSIRFLLYTAKPYFRWMIK